MVLKAVKEKRGIQKRERGVDMGKLKGIIGMGLMIIICGGCAASSNSYKKFYSSEEKIETELMNQIVEGINQQNEDEIIALFLDTTSQTETFEEEIRQLFKLFPNGIEEMQFINCSAEEGSSYGSLTKRIQSWFEVKDNENVFRILVIDDTVNTENPNREGIFAIHIMLSDYYYSNDDKIDDTITGIFFYGDEMGDKAEYK